jgi:hypothetical protein
VGGTSGYLGAGWDTPLGGLTSLGPVETRAVDPPGGPGILGGPIGTGSGGYLGVGSAGYPGALEGADGSGLFLGLMLVVGVLAFLGGLALRVSRLR